MLYQECIFLCGTLVLLRIPASPETVWFVIFPIILWNIYHKFPKYYKDEVRLYTMMYIFSHLVSHRPVFMYIFSQSVSHRPVFYVHFQSFSESSPCFYVHFQSFSESSFCFLCTFSVVQWVIVVFFMFIFSHSVSHRPIFYVHFQSVSESSSCFYVHFQSFSESSFCFLCTFSVSQWVIVLFFMYIFTQSASHRPVLRNFMMTCWRL